MSPAVLRPYTLADAEAIHRWRNDPETTRWMGPRFRHPATLVQVRQSLQRAIDTPADQARFFAIADASHAYLGGIDLTDLDALDRNGVLSMVVGRREDRGRGLGGEAVRQVLSFAFDTLGLHKVSLRVYEKNQAALRCYLRQGFQPEGRLRDHSLIDGEYCDLIPMGILESEYRRGLVNERSKTEVSLDQNPSL